MANKAAIATRETSASTVNHGAPRKEVAIRAHEIFMQRGATAGHDLDDWLPAEWELAKEPPRKCRPKHRQPDSRAAIRSGRDRPSSEVMQLSPMAVRLGA
jgi:Protein of unknown function (DUF2934)